MWYGHSEVLAENWMQGASQEVWPAAVGYVALVASQGAKKQTCPGVCDCPLETVACCPASMPAGHSGTEDE